MNFAELAARRKMAGHCSSCGRPFEGTQYKTCDKCRKRWTRVNASATIAKSLEKRITKLEMRLERQDKEIKRLRRLHELARRRAYINGARAAIKKIQSPTPEDVLEITTQEAAQISRAYGNQF